jgi:hypothetical protein
MGEGEESEREGEESEREGELKKKCMGEGKGD